MMFKLIIMKIINLAAKKVVLLTISLISCGILNIHAKDVKSNKTIAITKKNTIIKNKASWRTDWNKFTKKKDKKFPTDWVLKGTKWGVPSTNFYIQEDKKLKQNILVVDANKSTSTIIYNLSDKVDLNKTPIMRWSWKVEKFPTKADGRKSKTDDQVLGIYIGSGSFRQKSVAYRWETETPKNHEGTTSYGGGFVAVKWFAINNKKDKTDTWITVERNVALDYKKAYKFIPKDFAITIAGNSQYTKSHGIGMVAFIEFLEKPTIKKEKSIAIKK